MTVPARPSNLASTPGLASSAPIAVAIPQPVAVEIVKVPTLSVQAPEKTEDYHSSEWVLVWATVALVVVTAALAVFTYRLYRATVKLAMDAKATGDQQVNLTTAALGIADKSADAAMRSAEAAKETAGALTLSERAYVMAVVEAPGVRWGMDTGGKFEIRVAVINRGRTPASVSDVAISYRVLDSDDHLQDTSIPRSVDAVPKALLVPTDSFPHSRHFQLREPTLSQVQSYERTLWVFGHVDYVDTFGKRHRSGFARIYNRHLDDQRQQNLVRRVEGNVQYDYDRPRTSDEGNDWS